MKNNCKFCWNINMMLMAFIGAAAYMFVVSGEVTDSADGRAGIVVTSAERDFLLGEMQGFLETIQAVTAGVAAGDMAAIATSAKESGMAKSADVPASLVSKLPLGFKQLGMATHKAFDALAMEAEDMGDKEEILSQLARLMRNCTACHAAFRFQVENEG